MSPHGFRNLSLLIMVLLFGMSQHAFAQGSQTDALTQVRARAEQGDAEAQFNLGYMYDFGQGVTQNYGEAVKWYRRAAEQGHATAQNNLGRSYAKSEGVSKDAAQAVSWFRKAAEQGLALAQSNLGLMYVNGEGVPKDAIEAVEWFRKAAEQGLASAQSNLAVMYERGEGVPKDLVQKARWYRKAAEQGYLPAQEGLGLAYATGEGVTKDFAQAVEWFRKAAEQGDAEAQNYLGVAYTDGLGVPKDAVEAANWFRKAAEQGNTYAQEHLATIVPEVARVAVQDSHPVPSVASIPDYCPVKGRTEADVLRGWGKPAQIAVEPNGSGKTYYYETLDTTLRVRFNKKSEMAGCKKTVKYEQYNQREGGGSGGSLGPALINVAAQLYLTTVCPQLSRKPLLFLTATDLQTLQSCNANGFLIFGLYVYTGPQSQ